MTAVWRLPGGVLSLRRPLIMGIVNVTPDSFSDGGRFPGSSSAIEHGLAMAAAGADVVDVGGESTRPGAEPVDDDAEIARTIPVVGALAAAGITVSIDTMKPSVAAAALDAGAAIVNDVGGLGDPAMRSVIARAGAGAVVVHMQGTPRTMQDDPRYGDVVAEVIAFLGERVSLALESGIEPAAIAVDPGIGFGKNLAHNLTLLHRLGEFAGLGRPLVVGTSRKRFLGQLTGEDDPAARDGATAVTTAMAVERGAAVVRVHDVARSLEAAKVAWAIVREDGAPWGPLAVEGVSGG